MLKKMHDESGVSLIELMIGVGILSLIGYAAMHFFSRVTQNDAEISAKAKAQSELAFISSLLDKDLKFREMDKLTDLCGSALCTDLTIERLAPGGSTYKVTYASSCKDIPTNTIYGNLKFDKTTLANVSQCIKVLDCQAGKYPVLTITVANAAPGVQLPAYPPATPVYGQRTAFNLAGAAICAYKTTSTTSGGATPTTISKNRIVFEGAIIGSNKTIRVERKETVYSSNNMAKIQMLPN